jgi:hypothetical protein
VIYPCENLEDTEPCGAPATHIVRTPYSVRLVCDRCHYIFEAQGRDVKPLEFTCDWPVGGRECGEKATHFIETEGYHRPICAEHAKNALVATADIVALIDSINPKLVPYKPPTQAPRIHHKADGTVDLRCHCGAVGKISAESTLPLCDEHALPKVIYAPPPPDVEDEDEPPLRGWRAAVRDILSVVIEKLERRPESVQASKQAAPAEREADLIARVRKAKARAAKVVHGPFGRPRAGGR